MASTALPEGHGGFGRELRRDVPRKSHAEVSGRAASRDPVEVLGTANEGRIPHLVPIRHGRMLTSPFAFFRGSAELMAHDLADSPSTGIRVQLCGDAHISNFGLFATPERSLAFGLNDFDETLPGPWEWDVKRLVTSAYIAAQADGLSPAQCRQTALATAQEYRLRMHEFAAMRLVDVWFFRLDVAANVRAARRGRNASEAHRVVRQAQRRDHLRAQRRLTEQRDGRQRIRYEPPLLLPVDDFETVRARVDAVLAGYVESLPEDRRPLVARYKMVDLALKVVGVGSVGTRCWIALHQRDGAADSDPLFLQVKEAGPSALETYLGPSEYDHHGQRVVMGQRLMQAFADVFLGWTTSVDGIHYYVRQLHDQKGTVDLERLRAAQLMRYSQLCAWALARSHARGGEAAAIAGYLGNSDTMDGSLSAFAEQYAAQNLRDYEAFAEGGRSGRLPVSTEF